ncbi:MAG: nucleotidyltransferase family protein [Thermoflexales bacterium]|nr:nucleotidyltransferase family protein [Thermoflexales bacterium]
MHVPATSVSNPVQPARLLLEGLFSKEAPGQACSAQAEALGVAWLRAQGLAPMAWHALQSVPGMPPDFASELHIAYYAALADAELHERELKRVLQALSAQGVQPVMFKGAALAYTVYPAPACRPMGDLDLWVMAEEIPQARAALEAIGYACHTKSRRPLAMMKQNSGELQMVSAQAGSGLVELHWGTFAGEWLSRAANVDEAGLRARGVGLSLVGHEVLALAPEDALIQLAVHWAINHQLAYPWLRALVDVVLLARAQPVDWQVLAQRARAWRVSAAVWLVLSLAVELAGLEEARPAVSQLAPSRQRAWLLDRLANAASVVEMRDLREGGARFVYLLLMAERWQDAARLFWRALWPEHAWLLARYGQSGLAVQVRHLFNAIRGRL